jgi:hypothetical protein
VVVLLRVTVKLSLNEAVPALAEVLVLTGAGAGAVLEDAVVELCDEPPQAATPRHVMIATSDGRSLIASSIDTSRPP